MEKFLKQFNLTVSKFGALIIICTAPFVLADSLLLAAWGIGAGMLGWKQYVDKGKAKVSE